MAVLQQEFHHLVLFLLVLLLLVRLVLLLVSLNLLSHVLLVHLLLHGGAGVHSWKHKTARRPRLDLRSKLLGNILLCPHCCKLGVVGRVPCKIDGRLRYAVDTLLVLKTRLRLDFEDATAILNGNVLRLGSIGVGLDVRELLAVLLLLLHLLLLHMLQLVLLLHLESLLLLLMLLLLLHLLSMMLLLLLLMLLLSARLNVDIVGRLLGCRVPWEMGNLESRKLLLPDLELNIPQIRTNGASRDFH